jgi:hypothetical protein
MTKRELLMKKVKHLRRRNNENSWTPEKEHIPIHLLPHLHVIAGEYTSSGANNASPAGGLFSIRELQEKGK